MKLLRQRQKELLGMIVDTYVETVNPVGSGTIAKRFRKALSPATIRNEMHDLETREFITHPHTSAGRIPTDKGYRYYVDHLMPEPKISPREASFILNEYRKRMDNMETLIERTSRILSTLSEQAGFIVFPSFEESVLKRVEITSLGAHHFVVVWVTRDGFIQDRVVDMKEEIPEGELARLNTFLNQELSGLLLSDIKPRLSEKLKTAKDSLRSLYETAVSIVSAGFPGSAQKKLLIESPGNILQQPEFQDWDKSKRLFKILEAKSLFLDLIESGEREERVSVHIGVEHQCKDIWDCSLITAQYFVGDRRLGTLGILGPRRMPYGRVVSLVDYVSRCFGEALEQWL